MSDNTKTNSRNKSVKRTKKVKQKKKFGFFKKLFTILFCLFILLSVAASGVIFAIVKTSPNLDINGTILNLDQPSQLY
ncbi:hypothetical protein NVV37_24620, partial [Escherichia coli]|nr:hypothetical protein [Escherichia coli]